MAALITFQEVCKYYSMGDSTVTAADHISFEIGTGEFTAIVGSSGSGKSTCMNIIGWLDVPSEGTYLLDGQDVGRMNKNRLAEIRNELLGFIFQQYNLLPKLNLLENVELPLLYAGIPSGERRERAMASLARVGLKEKWKNMPSQLSGGMQQRAALARALAYEPDFLLMDEPFAALDYFTRGQMQQELLRIFQTEKKGILFVTHSIEEALTVGTRIVILENGICKKSYDLGSLPFPRDLMSGEMLKIKRELIEQIEEER